MAESTVKRYDGNAYRQSIDTYLCTFVRNVAPTPYIFAGSCVKCYECNVWKARCGLHVKPIVKPSENRLIYTQKQSKFTELPSGCYISIFLTKPNCVKTFIGYSVGSVVNEHQTIKE